MLLTAESAIFWMAEAALRIEPMPRILRAWLLSAWALTMLSPASQKKGHN
jgi:hypothetical protein